MVVPGSDTPPVAWKESRWQHLGWEARTAAVGSRKLKRPGSVVTSQSLITSPGLTYRFCSFEGNIFLSCLSQCCLRFIYMQEHLIQTDVRFCSNAVLSVKPSLSLQNKQQNSPLCPTPHLPDPALFISIAPNTIKHTVYLLMCIYLLSFPPTRCKFHEGRNFGLCCKHCGMGGGWRKGMPHS